MPGSVSDLLTTMQHGVQAINNLITQTVGSFNNIASQLSSINGQIGVRSFNGRTGAVVPSQGDYPTSLIPGSTTNNNAIAGNIGEFVTAQRVKASALSLGSSVTASIASISVTPGDWTIISTVGFTGSATSVSYAGAWATSSNTLPGVDSMQEASLGSQTLAVQDSILAVPAGRFNSSATQTLFLDAYAAFASGTVSAYGTISARRAR